MFTVVARGKQKREVCGCFVPNRSMIEKMDADDIQEDVDDSDDVQPSELVEVDALEYDESAYVMYHRAQTGA